MRTSSSYFRQGIAAKLLTHIIEQATLRGYKKLNLETGTAKAFLPAQKLYTQFGFNECEPFGDYELDPYSLFMSIVL
jgi:putative acetyltransferase